VYLGPVLDAELVPTTLSEVRRSRRVEQRPARPPARLRRVDLVRRFLALGAWLAWRRLRGTPSAVDAGIRLRLLLESLGGLWIKLGQLVAMRRDILPVAFCMELSLLQDRAPGFPGTLARRIVEEDLGGDASDLFAEFEEEPFAAASIGQIHYARLRGSRREVAVKVRRPYVKETMERDLAFVRAICVLLERLGVLREAHLVDFLRELDEAMREELDYRLEASSIARMRRSLRPHGLYVPRVFGDLCSARVLTMELIDGVLMSELIAARERDPERVSAWLEENDIDPARVGRLLHASLMRQIVEDNLFHGDLHPGNIILLRKSRVALIDFGSIGTLEARFRTLYRMLNRAMSDLDFEKVADLMSLIAPAPDPGIDWDRVRRNAANALRRAELRAYAPNLVYHERSMSTALLDIARSLAGSGFPIGWAFMRVDRAHVTLDASLTYLVPDVSYLELGQQYWKEARRRSFGPELRSKLMEGLRRARSVSGVSEIAERIDLVGESVRVGAASFHRSTRHAEQVMAVAAGLAAWTAGGLSFLAALVVGTRELPALLAAPLSRALPGLTTAAPVMPAAGWVAVAAALALASLRLRSLERSLAQRPAEEARAEAEHRVA
jgi:ubiquinone biosynthesis protein